MTPAIKKLRDEMNEFSGSLREGYNYGFDACFKLLTEKADEILVNALEVENNDDCKDALKQWREFVGDGE